MSEAVTKTIIGKCEEVSERGEWVTFHVNDGRQFPTKLSTKLQPLIELGRAASKGGEAFAWTYNESDGKENPHKPGTFYKNRYLGKVTPLSEYDAPEEVFIPKSDPTATLKSSGDVDWDAKERRDYRSRAWAQTISALTHTIKVDEQPGDVYRRLYALQRMIYRDIVRDLDVDAFEDDDVPF